MIRVGRAFSCRIERGGRWLRVAALAATAGLAAAGPAAAQQLYMGREDPLLDEVDAIYLKGLKYLVSTQNRNGDWPDARGQAGVVGLAVLAMLAHGEDPNVGPYSDAIKRALNFILGNLDRNTGYIGPSMYNHAFATLALAEAYGAVDDPRLGPALEKAVELIIAAQNRNQQGAWRYSPESKDADTTVSGGQMVALFAARNAGIGVPDEAIDKGLRFFLRCQNKEGGFGYTSASDPNDTRTAIGALVLALARQQDTSAFKNAASFLNRNAARQHVSHYVFYHEYYAAQAFFHISEEAWDSWNRRNIRYMGMLQRPDGSWESQFGTCFATAAALLSLALNYRFLPIYER